MRHAVKTVIGWLKEQARALRDALNRFDAHALGRVRPLSRMRRQSIRRDDRDIGAEFRLLTVRRQSAARLSAEMAQRGLQAALEQFAQWLGQEVDLTLIDQ